MVILVLAVLVDVRMGAQNVDHVRAPELTGKVERSLVALGGRVNVRRGTLRVGHRDIGSPKPPLSALIITD